MNKQSPKPHLAAVGVEAAGMETAYMEAVGVEAAGVKAAMMAPTPQRSNQMQKNATNVLPGMVEYASSQELLTPKSAISSLLRLLQVRQA